MSFLFKNLSLLDPRWKVEIEAEALVGEAEAADAPDASPADSSTG